MGDIVILEEGEKLVVSRGKDISAFCVLHLKRDKVVEDIAWLRHLFRREARSALAGTMDSPGSVGGFLILTAKGFLKSKNKTLKRDRTRHGSLIVAVKC